MTVTIATLASGADKELSRAHAGPHRAILFVRLANGDLGVATVALKQGAIERVLGVVRMCGAEVNELDHAVVAARMAWRGGR